MIDEGVYAIEAPAHGWTCFHCGETFTEFREARDHFGYDETSEAACRVKAGAERGLLAALRKAENELADAWLQINSESSDAVRAMYAQAGRHFQQIQTAEEAGYERGLRDGMRMRREELAEIDA